MTDIASPISPKAPYETVTADILHRRKTGRLESFKAALPEQSMEEIKDVAREFESVFLSQMIKPMFQGIEPDPRFGGGHAEKVFRGLMIDEIGKEFARAGGIGIAEMVEKELIQMQARMVAAGPDAREAMEIRRGQLGTAPGTKDKIKAYENAPSGTTNIQTGPQTNEKGGVQ